PQMPPRSTWISTWPGPGRSACCCSTRRSFSAWITTARMKASANSVERLARRCTRSAANTSLSDTTTRSLVPGSGGWCGRAADHQMGVEDVAYVLGGAGVQDVEQQRDGHFAGFARAIGHRGQRRVGRGAQHVVAADHRNVVRYPDAALVEAGQNTLRGEVVEGHDAGGAGGDDVGDGALACLEIGDQGADRHHFEAKPGGGFPDGNAPLLVGPRDARAADIGDAAMPELGEVRHRLGD